jgi:ABC-type nitrate/sulfonate/bicarbonate transport system permease component
MSRSERIIFTGILGLVIAIVSFGLYVQHIELTPTTPPIAQQNRHIIHVPPQDPQFSDPSIPSVPVMIGLCAAVVIGVFLAVAVISKPRWHKETRPDGVKVWVRESVGWFFWF